jgi:hypothetical protein
MEAEAEAEAETEAETETETEAEAETEAETESESEAEAGSAVENSGSVAGLEPPERGVGATARDQLLVGAALEDGAVLEHEDLVGVADGR